MERPSNGNDHSENRRKLRRMRGNTAAETPGLRNDLGRPDGGIPPEGNVSQRNFPTLGHNRRNPGHGLPQ